MTNKLFLGDFQCKFKYFGKPGINLNSLSPNKERGNIF